MLRLARGLEGSSSRRRGRDDGEAIAGRDLSKHQNVRFAEAWTGPGRRPDAAHALRQRRDDDAE